MPVGLAMAGDPALAGGPLPWYGSTRSGTYGDEGWSNFLNAAFLFHEALPLAAGEELRVRHRVLVHDGEWGADRLESAAADWTADG